jgi:GPH family glycoside/pentoside/hexuronide:cation symporter
MAMSYSGHLLALKIGIALGGALTAWILAGTGYQPNMEQTDAALQGILFNYAWASVNAGVLLLLLLSRYRLDRDWAERRAAGPGEVTA